MNAEFRQKGIDYSSAQLSKDIKDNLDEGLNKLAQLYKSGALSYDTLSKMVGTRHVSQIASMLEMINRAGGLAAAKDMYVYSTSLVDDALKAQSSWVNEWARLQHSIEGTKSVLMSFIDGPGVLLMKFLNTTLGLIRSADQGLGHVGSTTLMGTLGTYGMVKAGTSIWNTVQSGRNFKKALYGVGNEQANALKLVKELASINAGDDPKKIEKLTEKLKEYTTAAGNAGKVTMSLSQAIKSGSLSNIKNVITGFVTANAYLLAFTAAVAAGLYIWKKHEENMIEFAEAVKDAKQNLIDFTMVSRELSTEDRMTETILSQARAFSQLRGSITEAEYALTDILEKLADIKPIKNFMSEEVDAQGFSDLSQEAFTTLIKKQGEDTLKAFRNFYKDEINNWDQGENKSRIDNLFTQKKSLDPNTKRELILMEDMVSHRAINLNEIRDSANAVMDYYNFLQSLGEVVAIDAKRNSVISNFKMNDEERAELYRQRNDAILVAAENAGINPSYFRMLRDNNTTNSTIKIDGHELNLAEMTPRKISQMLREVQPQVNTAIELMKEENRLRSAQIDSIRALNSAINTYAEYYRGMVAKDMLAISGNYSATQMDALIKSNSPIGTYMKQYIDGEATLIREIGLEPDDVFLGDADTLKKIGELRAMVNTNKNVTEAVVDELQKFMIYYNDETQLLQSYIKTAKLSTPEDYYEFLTKLIPTDESMKKIVSDTGQRRTEMDNRVSSQIRSRGDFNTAIYGNTAGFLLGTYNEQELARFQGITDKYKEIFKKDQKDTTRVLVKIEQALDEKNISFNDYINYTLGNLDGIDKDVQSALKDIGALDKKGLVKSQLDKLHLFQNEIAGKMLEALIDNLDLSKIIDEADLSGMTDAQKEEYRTRLKENLSPLMSVITDAYQLQEANRATELEKSIIQTTNLRKQYDARLEDLRYNQSVDNIKKNFERNKQRFAKALSTNISDVNIKASFDNMDKAIDDKQRNIAYLQQQLSILYEKRQHVELNDIETNKQILSLESQILDEHSSALDLLLNQRNEIVSQVEDVFKEIESANSTGLRAKELIYERVNAIYSGVADDFLAIRENIQRQAQVYEKQYLLQQQYDIISNGGLTGKEKEASMIKYVNEYNNNVSELFQLQNDLISRQKSILENSISSALENMSRRARGEDLQLDVQGARTRFAQALSALAFKDEVKSPELLMVEGQKSQIELMMEANGKLKSLDDQLKEWYGTYKSLQPSIGDGATPGKYSALESGDKKQGAVSQADSLLLTTVKDVGKYIKENRIGTTTKGVNEQLLFSDAKDKIEIHSDDQGSKYYVISDAIDVARTENSKEELEKIKYQTDGYKLIGNSAYKFGGNNQSVYLGRVDQDVNGNLRYHEMSTFGNREDAVKELYETNKDRYLVEQELLDKINNGTLTVAVVDEHGNVLSSPSQTEKVDEGKRITKINANQEASYTNSISKLAALVQGLSAISVIIQDLKNAEFEKKIEDLKETFEDQRISLEREQALADNNADKFAKEVEMWNLEAEQQRELDTLTEENRIENNLVAINQTIVEQSMNMLQQLSAINENTNPDNIATALNGATGYGSSAKGYSLVQDAYGQVKVIGNNGQTQSLAEAVSTGVAQANNNIGKGKASSNSLTIATQAGGIDISKGNAGMMSAFGSMIAGGLQGSNIEFDNDVYKSAVQKLNSGNQALTVGEYQQLQYVLTNGGTLSHFGSSGDYLQSLTGIYSGIENESIGELGNGLSNLGKAIGGDKTMASITKFLNSDGFSTLSNTKLGSSLGLSKIKSGLLTPGESGTTLLGNTLGLTGGGLSAIGGGFQIGQMLGTGKFDLAGLFSAGSSLYAAGSALSGTALAGSVGTSLGAAAGSAGAAALGGAALAGAIALPAIAVGAYASNQLSRRAKAKAKLKQNDILREREAEQYQKMLEALNSQKNPLLNAMVQQTSSVGYDEAMRRALMSAPLTASSSELFKDYTVSYRGGKLGQGRRRTRWVYSAADATVGIQDFGYNTISDVSDSYGLLNNITAKMNELDMLMGTRGRDSGDRSQRKEWATWYATKEASQMLYDQIKDLQESMVKSLTTLTESYFGFETIGLNSKGGKAQDGETITSYTTGAWNERSNILNTFVSDFMKAGTTVGETIAKIFIEGASNVFTKNNTELNKLLNNLEDGFENLAKRFVNTDDLIEALDFEISSGSNNKEVYQSVFDQLKDAGYGTQEQYEQAQTLLNNKKFNDFVDLMKVMVSNGNSSFEQVQELTKTLADLEKVQAELENSMRDFVDQWVDGGGKLSDIIASMDNLLSRSADLLADLVLEGDSSAGLENFKTIITDKILPQIKDVMIDSMQQDIFGFEDLLKNFQSDLLSGTLSFSGADGLDNFVSDIGTMMDILSNPTANLDAVMDSMGGEALQKLLAYKNLMDEINEELYERMTIDEKIVYNQENLSQEAAKYKTELADHGFIDIGDLGETPFKQYEQELQDLLAVPVGERNAEWSKSYETLKEKIELAKNQYGTLNDTINKLEEDMYKSEMANQQFSQAWLDGVLKGDYSTIRDELATQTQDMLDSIISSMSSSEWEEGATSIGQSMASSIIDAYTERLISSGKLKEASSLLNEMLYDNMNFVDANGALNFDTLYQLSQQTQKLAKFNGIMVIRTNC